MPSKEIHESIIDFFTSVLSKEDIAKEEGKVDELYSLCDDPMQTPVKLVDDQLRFANFNSLQDLFVENTGFLVVGVLGLQSSGKSSILNTLANHLPESSTTFDGPFSTQSLNNLITNSPQTAGIDLYITQDRVILLDTQPLLSFALTNHHSQSSNKMDSTSVPADTHSSLPIPLGPNNWGMDVWAEMTSMQIVAFLMNVCHVVIVVSNNISTAPTHLHHIIDRAIGLKPTVFTTSALPQSSHNIHSTSAANGIHILDGKQQIGNKSKPGYHTATDVPNKSVHLVKPNSIDDGCDADDYKIDSISYGGQQQQVLNNTLKSGNLMGMKGKSNRTVDNESDDVAAALNRLRNMIDYSSCLIHVYNQAPVTAFLDSEISNKLNRYQYKILPMLYPEYRRLTALHSIGPKILSTHLIGSYEEDSNVKGSTIHNQTVHNNNENQTIETNKKTMKLSNSNGTCPEDGAASEGKLSQLGQPCDSENDLPVSLTNPSQPARTELLPSAKAVCPLPKPLDTDLVSEEQSSNPPRQSCPDTETKTTAGKSINSPNNDDLHHGVEERNGKFGPTEREIVAECCTVLRSVEDRLNYALKIAPISTHDPHLSPSNEESCNVYTEMNDDPELCLSDGVSGELLNANRLEMSNHVQAARRKYFDIYKRIDHQRLFLIPEVDDKGCTPIGCPTYSSSVRVLQEAVFSTPRQHMVPHFTEKKWIAYAQKMWELVTHSPLFIDYYCVLCNQL